jgi:hypothetical protein
LAIHARSGIFAPTMAQNSRVIITEVACLTCITGNFVK